MVSNGSFVVNNVNYTFNKSGVCLSETSAIGGGSAGSVYTPGTSGTQINGSNYTGTPATGNSQNGITTGTQAGSAPGGNAGTTATSPSSNPTGNSSGTGMAAGNYQTGGPGYSSGSALPEARLPQPPPAAVQVLRL